MIKFLLTGWFVIQSYSLDDNQHSYLVADPVKNMHIAFIHYGKLSYNEGEWVKLEMAVECEVVSDNPGGHMHATKMYICGGSDVTELKCTPGNSFLINGVYYC